mgnify:CR=1 FL=1
MKKIISVILIGTVVWVVFNSNTKIKTPPAPDNLKGSITITGAFALYPLAVKWAEEFRKIHPGESI